MTPIPQDPATRAATAKLIVATCAGNAPDAWFVEIRHAIGGPGMRQRFFPVRDYRAAVRYAIGQARDGNVYVGAAPRVRESGKAGDVDCSWLVWADIDREDAVARIDRFTVAPTFILLTGTSGHALAGWQLADPLPADQVESVNKRLALALGGDQAMTSANELIRPPSGDAQPQARSTAAGVVRSARSVCLPDRADRLSPTAAT